MAGLYARIEDTCVITAVAPEEQVDPRGFNRAVAVATERLREMAEDKL